MSAHTPGPWNAWPHPGTDGAFVVGPEQFHTVAEVRAGNTDDGLPEQTTANARLIAAAPDLLAALQFVMSAHGEQIHTAFEEAAAAIAKAEGGA